MLYDSTFRQMVKEHGRNVTFRKRAAGAFNVTTGVKAYTSTDYAVKAYFYDFSPDMFDGDAIQRGDRRVILNNKLLNGRDTPVPEVSDQLIGVGDTVNIIHVFTLDSGNNTVAYLLQVRE